MFLGAQGTWRGPGTFHASIRHGMRNSIASELARPRILHATLLLNATKLAYKRSNKMATTTPNLRSPPERTIVCFQMADFCQQAVCLALGTTVKQLEIDTRATQSAKLFGGTPVRGRAILINDIHTCGQLSQKFAPKAGCSREGAKNH